MEENFSMEWKILGMEWKWNGRKLPVWNMEKSSSIPYHALVTGSRHDKDINLFRLGLRSCQLVPVPLPVIA